MKPASLIKLLVASIKLREPVLITGRPGIGKSDIVEAAAKATGFNLIITHPVVSDPTDYKGLPFINSEDEANFLPLGELRTLINTKEPTIFFFDDLGQAAPSVQAAAMQLILARRINGHKISDNVTFIGATNRREDRAAVTGILEPLKSRFTIAELEATRDDWIDWALGQDWIPVELISAVRFYPKWITEWKPEKAIVNSPNPRNVAAVAVYMNAGLDAETMLAAFEGRLGHAGAIELNSFLRLYTELPSAEDIVNDPKGTPVPHQGDRLFALTGAMVGAVDEKNFAAFETYLNRLPDEYAILFVKDLIRKKEHLNTHRSFLNLTLKHFDTIDS